MEDYGGESQKGEKDIERDREEGKEKRRRWWNEEYVVKKRGEKKVEGMEKGKKARDIKDVGSSTGYYVKEERGRRTLDGRIKLRK